MNAPAELTSAKQTMAVRSTREQRYPPRFRIGARRSASSGRTPLCMESALVFCDPLGFLCIVVVMDNPRNVSKRAVDLVDALESVQRPVVFPTQEEFLSPFVNSPEIR